MPELQPTSGDIPQPMTVYQEGRQGRSRQNRQTNDSGVSPDLEVLAHWMDAAFRIPGIGIRFGLDAILGLIPGIGDFASSVASLYILNAAHRYNVPRVTVMRMALNIMLDTTIGVLPLVGDVFDAYWKSNQRNVRLLQSHMAAAPADARKLERSDRWFVIALMIALGALMIGAVVAAYWIIAWLLTALAIAFT